MKVVVGLRKNGASWPKVEKAGLNVMEVADAVKAACLPDGVTHVAVLAGDAPAGGAAVAALRQVIDDAAAAVVTDASGREQPMTAVYAVSPLRAVVTAYGEGRDMPIRQVLDDLRPQTVVAIIDQWSASADIDRPEDARRLGFS